jgi:hypothetical protein
MRKVIVLWLGLCLLPLFAFAKIEEKALVGKASLYYLLWHVYDIELYSADGDFSFDEAFALKLEYKLKLYGDRIADRSAKEIRRLGFSDEIRLAAWHAQMKDMFPDVDDGSSLTGAYNPIASTVFYKDGNKIGVIEDPEFGKWFFGIWLHENASQPKLRQALLGNKK